MKRCLLFVLLGFCVFLTACNASKDEATAPTSEKAAPASKSAAPAAENAAPAAEGDTAEFGKLSPDQMAALKKDLSANDAAVSAAKPAESKAEVALPEILIKLKTPPTEQTPESLTTFIQLMDNSIPEIQKSQEALQKIPEEQLQKVFAEIQTEQKKAADALLKMENTTEAQKGAAVSVLAMDMLAKGQKDAKEKLVAMQADYDKQGLKQVSWNVGYFLLLLDMPQPNEQGTVSDEAAIAFADKTIAFLASAKGQDWITPAYLDTFSRLIATLEMMMLPKKAAELAQTLADSMEKSQNPQILEARDTALGIARRLGLEGQTMEFVGKTLDGKTVNLKDYAGKVVLIDFWATWCGPCLAEIPNVKSAYEQYHERGFEVIAFSVDNDVEALKKFAAEQKFPWAVVTKSDEKDVADPSEFYSVFSIPCMILVGADGKVLSIDIRGKLNQTLAKLFPMTDEEKAALEAMRLPELEPSASVEEIPAPAENSAEEAPKAEEVPAPAEKPAEEAPKAEEIPAPAEKPAEETPKAEDVSAPSESTSTESPQEAPAIPAADPNAANPNAPTPNTAAPNAVDPNAPDQAIIQAALVLPEDKSVASLVSFLKSNAVFSEMWKMPQADAMALYSKVLDAKRQAATLVLAAEKIDAEALDAAVNTHINVLLAKDGAGFDADPELQKLVKTLNDRKILDYALLVEASRMMLELQRMQKMPDAETLNRFLDRIITLSNFAKANKCIRGEVMSIFLRLIMMAADGGSMDKINTACNALREALLVSDDPNIVGSADTLTGMARRITLPGKPMKLVGADLEGNEITLDRFKGKVVLVDFWATWCTPCIRELANLRSVYEKYHKRGFEILAFSIDRDMDALKAFVQEKQMPWTVACYKLDDERDIADPYAYYGILGIPCMILIGADGNVITINARGDRLLQALDNLFPETK